MAVAKTFVLSGAHYIFSKKRKRSAPKSDKRLELLGGGFRDGTHSMCGLICELMEEEPTGIIAARVLKQRPRYKKRVVDKQDHYIFTVVVGRNDIEKMEYDKKESRGFVEVKRGMIHDKNQLRNELSDFTPKTRKIFRALGLLD